MAFMTTTSMTPLVPNSDEELELELAAFHAANHNDVPKWARDVVARLWFEVCAREAAVLKDIASGS